MPSLDQAELRRAKAGVAETVTRLADAIGRHIEVVVNWDSFTACEDQRTAFEVLIEHALDRIAGAVEWMCEWESCRRTLASHLDSFYLSYTRDSKRMWCDRGRFSFEDNFGSDTGFPQANACAQILDENLRLYEGRVYDIRHRLVPGYEERIAKAVGGKVELKLDLDNFSRLDWEGDDYYNAYTELTPSNADAFFGRISRAFESVFPGVDPSKASQLTMVKIKLSIKGHRRIKLRNGVLKMSERFWLGPEHSEQEIADYMSQTFSPAADLQQWIDELRFDHVPSYEDRVASLLGRSTQNRIPLVFNWKSFDLASDPIAAIETVRTTNILSCITEAIEKVVQTHPSAINTLRDSLRAVRIEFCPSNEQANQAVDVVRGQDGAIGGTEVRDRPHVIPRGTLDLRISSCWELGAKYAPSVRVLYDAIVKGFQLGDATSSDVFQVTYLKQTADEAEVHGQISNFDQFKTVFKMMEDYSKKSRSGFPQQVAQIHDERDVQVPPRPRQALPQPSRSNKPPQQQQQQQQQQRQSLPYAALPAPQPAPATAATATATNHLQQQRQQYRQQKYGVAATNRSQSTGGSNVLNYANDLRDDADDARRRSSGVPPRAVVHQRHSDAYPDRDYHRHERRNKPDVRLSGGSPIRASTGPPAPSAPPATAPNASSQWQPYQRNQGGSDQWQVRLVSGPETHAGTGHEITLGDAHHGRHLAGGHAGAAPPVGAGHMPMPGQYGMQPGTGGGGASAGGHRYQGRPAHSGHDRRSVGYYR